MRHTTFLLLLLIFGCGEDHGGHHDHTSRKFKVDYFDTLKIKVDSLASLYFLDTNIINRDISKETWELDTNRLKISNSDWNEYFTKIPSIAIRFNDSSSVAFYRPLDDLDSIEHYSMYIHHKFSIDGFHLFLLYDTFFEKDYIRSKHILITNTHYQPVLFLSLLDDIYVDRFIQFSQKDQILKLNSYRQFLSDERKDSLIYIIDFNEYPEMIQVGFFNRLNYWED